jgi:ADP-heptose:LPS heptosyltransferase
LAARLDLPRPSTSLPCIHVGEVPADWPAGEGKAWLLLHPGASAGKAGLPLALLREIVADWLAQAGRRVAVVGTGEEAAVARDLQTAFGAERVHDYCDRLALPDLAAMAAAAGLFVGRDCGPARVAASAGGRTVVISAPLRRAVSIRRWRPLGPRVEVVALPGRARWWEKTARATARVYAGADPATVIAVMRRVLAIK